MSVLIKGMKKSESCEYCDFLNDDGCCIAMGGDELKEEAYDEMGYLKSDYIDPDCTVVGIKTPHGRLIDADKLKVELECGIRAGNYEEGYENYAHINNVDDCVECVRYADTIIEEENEE